MLPSTVQFFETDLVIPSYTPSIGRRWELRVAELAVCKGYWSSAKFIRNMAVLVRREGERTRSWMSMTPMEIESQEIGCRLATGYTAVMGMGMGWAAINAAIQPAVTRVTVVERDPEVIALIRDNRIFEQIPPESAAKIDVVEADALEWRSETPVDTLLADIWLPLNGDDRVDQVRVMHANTGATRIYFWGQEMVFARRARDSGRTLDDATLAAIIADLGLPLIGPEWPDYATLCAHAATHWLRDP